MSERTTIRTRDNGDGPRGFLDAFFKSMGRAATGVTIVTTDGPAGRAGQTVSATASASDEPPMVLVSVHGRSPVNRIIEENGVFSVNVLGVQHDHVADTFAGRPWPGKGKWDFTCGDWECDGVRPPRIRDAVVSLECDVETIHVTGSHLVHIGRVREIHTHEGTPLVYAGHVYNTPEPLRPSIFHDYPDARPQPRVRKKP
ncbi:flavin reductase family protein [Streptomyces sp. NPDC056716]|uniref:flavin reductase family protein n=1 Tax=unclassified Streptomyces TaxID=2593676 RepID=UPI0036B18574